MFVHVLAYIYHSSQTVVCDISTSILVLVVSFLVDTLLSSIFVHLLGHDDYALKQLSFFDMLNVGSIISSLEKTSNFYSHFYLVRN